MLLRHARSLLFLPASNARAAEKARGLGCDVVILDLEDAVKPEDKGLARDRLGQAVATGFGHRLVAARINIAATPWNVDDLAAVRAARPDLVVLPKVEYPEQITGTYDATTLPVIGMIETAVGLANLTAIAKATGIAGLFVGTNDLRQDLSIPAGAGRAGLTLALQSVVLAARAADIAVFDGVYNKLDDAEGFAAECREGHSFGFDGKTLIHPNQVDPCNAVFGPSPDALADARRLVEAATGGAERFEGRMIESMHVAEAEALIARAEAVGMTG